MIGRAATRAAPPAGVDLTRRTARSPRKQSGGRARARKGAGSCGPTCRVGLGWPDRKGFPGSSGWGRRGGKGSSSRRPSVERDRAALECGRSRDRPSETSGPGKSSGRGRRAAGGSERPAEIRYRERGGRWKDPFRAAAPLHELTHPPTTTPHPRRTPRVLSYPLTNTRLTA